MIDMQPVAGLRARHPGKDGIPPEPRGRERKPWTRRDDRALTAPLSTSFLRRVSTKIPCWGCNSVRI